MKCTILRIVEVWKYLNRSMKNDNLTSEDWPRCNQKLTENWSYFLFLCFWKRMCTELRMYISKTNKIFAKYCQCTFPLYIFRNKYAPHYHYPIWIMKLNLTDSLRCRVVVANSVFYGIDLLVVSILQFYIWGDNNIDRNKRP